LCVRAGKAETNYEKKIGWTLNTESEKHRHPSFGSDRKSNTYFVGNKKNKKKFDQKKLKRISSNQATLDSYFSHLFPATHIKYLSFYKLRNDNEMDKPVRRIKTCFRDTQSLNPSMKLQGFSYSPDHHKREIMSSKTKL